jgi:hypothetical protein
MSVGGEGHGFGAAIYGDDLAAVNAPGCHASVHAGVVMDATSTSPGCI